MERYGEYLFDAFSEDLKECIENLSGEEIEDCCEYKIFDRGLSYYHNGMVRDIHLHPATDTLSATVLGSEEYHVEIYLEDHEVHGSCTCPYQDVCKHIVAVLLHLAEERTGPFTTISMPQQAPQKSREILEKHLKSLSKDELVELLLQFLPESYVTQVVNSQSGPTDARNVFYMVEKNIMGFFDDPDLLWDPSGFEASLMNQLNQLQGLEKQLPVELGKLIITIMEKVEEAFDEGYLYIDHYYEEDYFESKEFCDFVIRFVRSLTFYPRIAYIFRLDEVLNHSSYSTFEEIDRSYAGFFSQEELQELKNYVLEKEKEVPSSFISRLYHYLEPGFSDTEKEKILLKLLWDSDKYLVILVELLVTQKRYDDAYARVHAYLADKTRLVEHRIMELYLELSDKLGHDMAGPSLKAVKSCPSASMLRKIKAMVNGNTKQHEAILRKEAPQELLFFYEKERRLEDALLLIKGSKHFYDGVLFTFFKQNKRDIPSEAEAYFMKRIDENLQHTGDDYYTRIAETIGQIRQVNPELAIEILTDIRLNYKRRTKLMGMLKRFD